jgi:hypothetical protein
VTSSRSGSIGRLDGGARVHQPRHEDGGVVLGSRVGFELGDVTAGFARLEELGVRVYETADCWETAAAVEDTDGVRLGDACSLATAHPLRARS